MSINQKEMKSIVAASKKSAVQLKKSGETSLKNERERVQTLMTGVVLACQDNTANISKLSAIFHNNNLGPTDTSRVVRWIEKIAPVKFSPGKPTS